MSGASQLTAAILLLASVLLVLACGAFVAAEFSLVTVDRASVDRAAEDGDRRAQASSRRCAPCPPSSPELRSASR